MTYYPSSLKTSKPEAFIEPARLDLRFRIVLYTLIALTTLLALSILYAQYARVDVMRHDYVGILNPETIKYNVNDFEIFSILGLLSTWTPFGFYAYFNRQKKRRMLVLKQEGVTESEPSKIKHFVSQEDLDQRLRHALYGLITWTSLVAMGVLYTTYQPVEAAYADRDTMAAYTPLLLNIVHPYILTLLWPAFGFYAYMNRREKRRMIILEKEGMTHTYTQELQDFSAKHSQLLEIPTHQLLKDHVSRTSIGLFVGSILLIAICIPIEIIIIKSGILPIVFVVMFGMWLVAGTWLFQDLSVVVRVKTIQTQHRKMLEFRSSSIDPEDRAEGGLSLTSSSQEGDLSLVSEQDEPSM